MSDSVKITGLEEACDALRNLAPNLAKRGLKKALLAGAEPIRQSMISKVRRGWHIFQSGNGEGKGRSREYGFTAGHIGVTNQIHTDQMNGVARVGPVKKAFWAMFLEFGTSKMKAFPFARPAYDENKERAVNSFVESLRATLQEVLGKK
jgi:HK97 gp10 family phage protein